MVGPIWGRKNNFVAIPRYFHSNIILHILDFVERALVLTKADLILFYEMIDNFIELYVIFSRVVRKHLVFKLVLKRLVLSEDFLKQIMEKLSDAIFRY